MASYVITGASRGIGLELTKQLLQLPATQVGCIFALTRSSPSSSLQDLIHQNPERAIHIPVSVDNTESVRKAAREVEAKLGGKGLDVLVNNAGKTAFSPGGVQTMPAEQMADLFDTNVIGVQRVTAAFLPLLEKGGQKKVINISTTMGSNAWAPRLIGAPSHAYKVSKAALNMLNTQYALSLADAGFTFLLVSPGWLKTDLGGEGADLPLEVGVADVKRIILEANTAQNGKFLNIHVAGKEDSWGQYNGKEIGF